MKQNKTWNIVRISAYSLQLLTQILTLAIIWKLNILPTEYALILVGVFVVFAAVTGVMFFVPGKEKRVGAVRSVIACVIALFIVCGCGVASIVLGGLNDTMNEVTNAEPTGIVRSVYVRADDPALTLQDAKDYTFAYAQNYDGEYTSLALADIQKQLGSTVKSKAYATVQEMVDALLSGDTDAMVLNDAYVNVLQEDENYGDFTDKTRILADLYLEPIKQAAQESKPSKPSKPEFHAPKRITSSPFAVYVSGSDTRSAKLDVSRSDVNILIVVNPVTKQILLLNTPRDYYVPNPAGNGSLDKLTHCGIYGVDCSIQALSDLYDVEIDYYAQINFTGFETLIDAVDGVTVYSDVAFTATGTVIQAGANHLNGEQALSFARERYNLSGGDNARGKNQMKVITAVIEKMTSGTTLIKNYAQILESLEGMFVTNMPASDITKLVKMQLSDMAQWNVNSFAVTGTGGSERTYSMPGSYAYVMHPHENVVAHASKLIDQICDGYILTEEDLIVK